MTAYTINDILQDIRLKALTEKQKGTDFERIMKRFFLSDPRYANLTKVWLWEEFPGRKDFGGKDLGIDLVAKTDIGEYWAIQCKCYKENAVIDKPAVDSFLANANRSFTEDETLQTRTFSHLVWVDTTRKGWGNNAREAIKNLIVPFNRISLFDLEQSSVDWAEIKNGKQGDEARKEGKQPRPHQLVAISKAHKYFIEEHHERGKLIMACGTGKTYTSLKIMEALTDPNATILFLVPSIALLGQTLNAWSSDKSQPMHAICVCSDAKVTRKAKDDDEDDSVIDLAVPATTNTRSIVQQLHLYEKMEGRTVIMSTYQSIDAVSKALKQSNTTVDLCICDEAHRTTGVKIHGQEESNFTKVHDNDIIPAKMRLYMTATPRLYRESVKVKAKENDDVLCSMDDKATYGEEFHRLSFNDAVSQGLLTDYKVLVLTVGDSDLPTDLSQKIKQSYADADEKDKIKELNFDDATKLIGCINGLSKRIKGDKGVTRQEDPVMMRRAVAFCQTINPTKKNPSAASTQIAKYFSDVCTVYKQDLDKEDRPNVVNIQADHIDGSMDANTRNEKLAWLKADADDPNECRVLCNVRCLSEGVDVPALDAVLFLSPRNSEVEVVQSVGRVMRSFGKGTDHEKKYGYIIIPIIVPEGVTPEEALNDNERFKVVWTILNALRSHDENFNAHVNKINLNRSRTPKITVGGVPTLPHTHSIGNDAPDSPDHEPTHLSEEEVAKQLELRFGQMQDGIYARIVEKVGDKMYWANWAKEVGEIAQKFIERIASLIKTNAQAATDFHEFVEGLQKNINPSVNEGQAIEMLAQHMITGPVFDALFKDYQFATNNAVSRSMQKMLTTLHNEGFEMETQVLDRFYASVRQNVGNIDNLEGKQTIIKNLYEKFFKGAFPLTVQQLGIVYTPIECVDFIIRSVNDILQQEFSTSLTERNVHILDPFVGTGTFITRLLQSGLIRPEDMQRKYRDEIHCNEIVLLAYYIADVNIESVFHEAVHPDSYLPYDGICLTDTFQLNEHGDNDIFSQLFPENSERVLKQKKAPVRVIIGNPPYSVGQKTANDNAQNLKYQVLDSRIEETYAKHSTATLKTALYDSYIKAFRWASDRISKRKEGGIVAFISNGSWLDGNAQDGMRKCLQDEFTSIYVLNLRGNARTSGEMRRKEAGNVFREGSRTPIAITFLVYNPDKPKGHAQIFYHDIGDYLTREDKLRLVKSFRSIKGVEWRTITPNEKHDWINLRDGVFDTLIPIASKVASDKVFFAPMYSNGIKTNRDSWCYNSNHDELESNLKRTIDFYNQEVDKYQAAKLVNPKLKPVDVVSMSASHFSWDRQQKEHDCVSGKKYSFTEEDLRVASYRPFFKQNCYMNRQLNNCVYQIPKLFPTPTTHNLVICVSSVGSTKGLSALITDKIPDLHFNGDTQCFPLYYYEENKQTQLSLFDNPAQDEKFIRRDGITDWVLKECRKRLNAPTITKEQIFYYVYGLLHSEDYRTRFAADLKKSLPRIPIVDDVNTFMDFVNAGRKLADIHLHYEQAKPHPDVIVEGDRPVTYVTKQDPVTGGFTQLPENADDYEYFRIPDKLRYRSKEDKSTILYNGHITISSIPEKAQQYIVNGKSALDWLVERYCVKTDEKSQIKNDANDWARDHHRPRYILDLILSVISVSCDTVDITSSLPHLTFD